MFAWEVCKLQKSSSWRPLALIPSNLRPINLNMSLGRMLPRIFAGYLRYFHFRNLCNFSMDLNADQSKTWHVMSNAELQDLFAWSAIHWLKPFTTWKFKISPSKHFTLAGFMFFLNRCCVHLKFTKVFSRP